MMMMMMMMMMAMMIMFVDDVEASVIGTSKKKLRSRYSGFQPVAIMCKSSVCCFAVSIKHVPVVESHSSTCPGDG